MCLNVNTATTDRTTKELVKYSIRIIFQNQKNRLYILIEDKLALDNVCPEIYNIIDIGKSRLH